jgi:hypothetical protein
VSCIIIRIHEKKGRKTSKDQSATDLPALLCREQAGTLRHREMPYIVKSKDKEKKNSHGSTQNDSE